MNWIGRLRGQRLNNTGVLYENAPPIRMGRYVKDALQ